MASRQGGDDHMEVQNIVAAVSTQVSYGEGVDQPEVGHKKIVHQALLVRGGKVQDMVAD